MICPEETTNFVRGKGFVSNDDVITNYKNEKYKYSEKTWQDAVLDYFGFKGAYNPNSKGASYVDGIDYYGSTNINTGNVSYGDLAFESYKTLLGVSVKESYTVKSVKRKAVNIDKNLPKGMKLYPEEADGFAYMYSKRYLFKELSEYAYNQAESYALQSGTNNPIPSSPVILNFYYNTARLW